MLLTAILAIFVLLCAISDVRSRTISNWLNFAGFALAILLRGLPGGESLASGLLAALVCAAVSLPLFALGAMGGGDGKMFIAAGAFVGIERTGTLLVATALAGGALALVSLARAGRLRPALHGMLLLLYGLTPAGVLAGRTISVPEGKSNLFLPYGLAIAAGSLLTRLAPAPWVLGGFA